MTDERLAEIQGISDRADTACLGLTITSSPVVTSDALRDSVAEVIRLRAELAKLIVVAHEFGWNGVENSKILAEFFRGKLEELDAIVETRDWGRSD